MRIIECRVFCICCRCMVHWGLSMKVLMLNIRLYLKTLWVSDGIKVYTQANSLTWLRLVRLTELNISKFFIFWKFLLYKLPLNDLWESDNKQTLKWANLPLPKWQNLNSNEKVMSVKWVLITCTWSHPQKKAIAHRKNILSFFCHHHFILLATHMHWL